MSSSSPPPHLLQSQQDPPSSRRLPPPCWSHDETVALIDSYREKWYSLRRGNLRASHWQEVADTVALRCPLTPQKTSVQCRHKMEKLRKRYRAEIQRAVTTPKGHRYCSSWVHFNRMDAMEKGSSLPAAAAVVTLNAQPIYRDLEEEEEDGDEEDRDDLYSGRGGGVIKEGIPINPGFYGSGGSNGVGGKSGGGGPFRIKIPGRSNAPPTAKVYSKFNECNTNYGQSPMYNSGNAGVRDGYMGRFGIERNGGGGGSGGGGGVGGKRREGTPVDEMVEAIKMLGDGFVRMERMKMDMAREIEGMRMEMEMKRTEMILESQQKVVETFAKAILESNKNKKMKRMPSPES